MEVIFCCRLHATEEATLERTEEAQQRTIVKTFEGSKNDTPHELNL